MTLSVLSNPHNNKTHPALDAHSVEHPRHAVRGDERAGDVLRELDDGDGHQAHVHRPVGDLRALLVAVVAALADAPVAARQHRLEGRDVDAQRALREELRDVRDGPHRKLGHEVPDEKFRRQHAAHPERALREERTGGALGFATPHRPRREEQHVEERAPHAAVARARGVEDLALAVQRHGEEQDAREHDAHQREALRGVHGGRLQTGDGPVKVDEQRAQHHRAHHHPPLHVRGRVPVAHARQRNAEHVQERQRVVPDHHPGVLHLPDPDVPVPPPQNEKRKRRRVYSRHARPRVHAVRHQRAERHVHRPPARGARRERALEQAPDPGRHAVEHHHQPHEGVVEGPH
mmetsp:Transcript_5023/g.20130  ORF Transcript_5023/g.20130 Transcript_5023/m.20130 type:complete len:347 (+) Transcript_5023:38-1078(+)